MLVACSQSHQSRVDTGAMSKSVWNADRLLADKPRAGLLGPAHGLAWPTQPSPRYHGVLSTDAVGLLAGMLQLDAGFRLGCDACLHHCVFKVRFAPALQTLFAYMPSNKLRPGTRVLLPPRSACATRS